MLYQKTVERKSILVAQQSASPAWLLQMTDTLLRQLLETCAGIRACCAERRDMDEFAEVYAEIDGTYHARLSLRAGTRLWRALAENILGGPLTAPDDPEEYAKEFLNILCGRLVSDIFRLTHSPARFFPPRWTQGALPPFDDKTHFISTLYYMTWEGEPIELHWVCGAHFPTIQQPCEGSKYK